MTKRKARTSQNLVQVSTYVPLTVKLQIATLAEKQGLSSYALLRSIVEDFMAKAEAKGLVQPSTLGEVKGKDEELLG